MKPLVLGTRGSDLALWQANHVREAISRLAPEVEVRLQVIRTRGDDTAGDVTVSGAFTTEIRYALAAGTIDLAVHSLKDLPTAEEPALALAAVMFREDAADALIARSAQTLADLPRGAKVLAGSPRRRALLLNLRPDLDVLGVRGNVPTRVGKFDSSGVDGIVLAMAGLKRLGASDRVSERLEPRVFVPAPGQGAVAVESRAGDTELLGLLRQLDHHPSRLAATAERAFLRATGVGCRAPAGAYAAFEGPLLRLDAVIASLDGARLVRRTAAAPAPDLASAAQLGSGLAAAMLASGGANILARANS